MLKALSTSSVRTFVANSLVCLGLTLSIQAFPSHAQSNLVQNNLAQSSVETDLLQEVLPLQASLLAAIREAPLSELFTVTMASGATGYGVKDQDFDPGYRGVGLYSLWGDVPADNILQVAMFYCFRNPALANATLEEVVIKEGDQRLVTLDQKVISTQALDVEVTPERYETINYYDPFYDPFWGGVYYGGRSHVETVYIPAQNCSVGGGRFDLTPVTDAIAQLPNKTLNVRLVFSNGLTENWRLGQGTVEQLKRLPSFQ